MNSIKITRLADAPMKYQHVETTSIMIIVMSIILEVEFNPRDRFVTVN